MEKLFQNLKKFKNKIALVGIDGKKYSYSEILNKSKYLNSKIKNNSLILIIASNNVNSIIGYVSFVKSENTSILLDKSFKLEYFFKIIKKYKPNYIFCPKEYLTKINQIREIAKIGDYFLIKTNFKKNGKINKKNLLLLPTSGTTQSPKFVRLSGNNLFSNTKTIIKYLKIESSHTTITTMPMGYSYGLSIINTHLFSGSKIIITDKSVFDKEFWNVLQKYKITSFGGVPQFYEQLKKLRFENFNLSNLKYITQAGGKLDLNYLKYFEKVSKKKGIKFIAMYGQAEASPRMSYLPWNKFSKKMGSIGKPLNGSKFEIINNKGKYITNTFTVGELVYFGKNVSLGYARSLKDLKKGDENKERLFTGDLAYKDDDNFFYIAGRKKRISKIFGIRVDLDDIERKLKDNKYNIKCVPDNRHLKILIVKNYDTENMKRLIYDFYGINKNFILISKVRKFDNTNTFKQLS